MCFNLDDLAVTEGVWKELGWDHQNDAEIDKRISHEKEIIKIQFIGDKWGIEESPIWFLKLDKLILFYKLDSYDIDLIQEMNDFILTDSIEIGINEWFAPQISEHWP